MKIGRSILIAFAAGCGAADSTDTERAPLPPVEDPDRPIAADRSEKSVDTGCPLALPGAQVSSEVTSDGVALVFTAAAGDAAELKARVHRMADRHNAAQVPAADGEGAGGSGEGGMTSPEGAHGMDMHAGARQVPSRAAVEETASGARIVFTPSDPAKLPVLREQIRVHGKEMATTGCVENRPPMPQAAPPSGESRPAPEPTPSPGPEEPVMPDRPVTPDQPVTPPSPPPPPTGEPFVQ